MRTFVLFGSVMASLAALAVPACGGGDLVGGGSNGGGDCNSVCAAMLKAQCPNTGTQQECTQECQAYVASIPGSCSAQLTSALSCRTSATYTCNSDGIASTSSCSSQENSLETCRTSAPAGSGGTGGTPGTGGTGATTTTGGTAATGGATCTSVCTRAVTVGCPNDTLSACVADCQTAQSETASCSSQFSTWLNCLNTATFTCSSSGTAATNSCTTQATAMANCLNTGTGWVCPTSWYGSDDGCDCGCAVADPDCAGSGCITPGCNDSDLYPVCVTSN